MAITPGWKKALHIAAESTWGTLEGSPAYKLVPYNSQTLKATRTNVAAEQFVGIRQRMHQESVAYSVGGQITCPLFAWQDSGNVSIAQHLVSWATNQPAGWNLDSKTVEVEDNIDNKRYLGCRVNSMTISGAALQPVMLTLDLLGKTEAGGITAQTITKATAVAIEQSQMFMSTAVIEVPSATAINVADFSLTLQNNLQPDFLNDTVITNLTAGIRVVDFSFTIRKAANTYDALRRAIAESNTTAQIILKGLHKGTGATGNYTTLTIDIDRMAFSDATDVDGDRNALISQSPSYAVLTPASTDNDIDLTWGESAS